MIEPTDEMVRAYFKAATEQARKVRNSAHPVLLEGSITRAGLAAVLAVVARDRCMEAAGHVWNPSAPPACGVEGPSGFVCARGRHRTGMHGALDGRGELVRW